MIQYSDLVGGLNTDNLALASDFILSDINYGFFILAFFERDSDERPVTREPAGFMFFTYEWSDWRDGLFFWMQSCHMRPDLDQSQVLKSMVTFLQSYIKERGCVGLRVSHELRLKEAWAPLTKALNMQESRYYIYDINVSEKK